MRRGVVLVLLLTACSSSSRPDELVATSTFAPDTNCPAGGEAITTGLDSNGDGVLQPDEVTGTSYVCSGTNTLVTVVAEPPGVNCTYGGQAIETGADTNGNGVLDASEVTGTRYVCDARPAPTMIEGDVVVSNTLDAAQLIGVTSITGTLTISAPALTTIDLSALQTIGGELTVTDFGGASLALPALTHAAAIDIESQPQLTTLALPVLAAVDGSIMLQTLPALATLALPQLATVGDTFSITGPAPLTAIELPALTTVPELDVLTLTALDHVSLPLLATSAIVLFDADTIAQPLALPALTRLSNSLQISLTRLPAVSAPVLTFTDGIVFEADPTIATISLPALATINGELVVDNNLALTTVTMSALAAASSCRLSFNPDYPTCDAQQIATHCSGMVIVQGNDATCPN